MALSHIIEFSLKSEEPDLELIELCLLSLYNRQEDHEQEANSTIEDNGVGFNTADADYLTEMAKRLELGNGLRPEDWGRVAQKLQKYCRQLSTINEVAQYFE